ncbi:hypothetical protein LTR56_006309 [Elasticomyces elasticus]|nr:hypothetical protein LTR56_006309 [Elasticomyces elasticus]KAK3663357.1 hypothetical protein LTR22_005764 [Elasticomyces elasticus]KAK4925436.1 hypothetical protein LTR49_007500 [Elasticomyces elasticus]KAK5764531.1 hypothetical protein LTS12_005261 [Elasticomyces elasticus]
MADLLLGTLEMSTYMPNQPQHEAVADLRIRLEQTQHQVVKLQTQYRDIEARLATCEARCPAPVGEHDSDEDLAGSSMLPTIDERAPQLKRERSASEVPVDTIVKSEELEKLAAS